MKLNRLALVVAAAGLLASGACNRDANLAPGAPAPAPSAPPAVPEQRQPAPPPPLQKVAPPVKKVKKAKAKKAEPAPPVGPAGRLSPRGLGPYTAGTGALGLKLGDLLADYHADEACPNGMYYGKGTASYHSPYLTFTDKAKLLYIDVESPEVATTAGVRIGTPFATAKRLHPHGRQYDNQGVHAWVVTRGHNALLMSIENGKVSGFEAGDAEAVVFRFTDGEGC
jgi:hypothetical protein